LTMVFSLCACGEKAPEAFEVHNFAELNAALAGEEATIKLADDFTTEGEETAQVNIERAVVLDGNGANIDFGFEVLTGGVTIKNFNITTSEWGKAVCKNGKDDGNGNMTKGDCIAIEIHNTTDVPVIIENNTIVHDVFLNNNSSVYLADGTYAEVLNNNIKTENKSDASFERGGIYIGSGTRGKIIGNTIDSAKTAMPMSPVGLTANLDAMEAAVEMPAIEIKDNTCESIYVTKMYTNGELFGEDGLIKADDTDFEVRENLEKFFAELAANNTFTTKEGLAADENIYVSSRLDLIYAGTPLKQASNYFNVVDGKLVEGPAEKKLSADDFADAGTVRNNGAEYRAEKFAAPYVAVETEIGGKFMVTVDKGEPVSYHVFMLHGGGFSMEPMSMHADKIRAMVDRGLRVTAFAYPLFPENDMDTMHAAVDEAYYKIREMYPDDKFAVYGDSAGGTLGMTLLMRLRDRGEENRPMMSVFASPALDLTMSNPDILLYAETDKSLNYESSKELGNTMAGPNGDPKDPKFSPLFGDLTNLGEVLLFYGEGEILRPDCEVFANMELEGTNVTAVMGAGMFHDYLMMVNYGYAPAVEAFDTIGEFLK